MPPPAAPRFVLQWEDSFVEMLLYVDGQGNVSADFLEGFPVDSVTGSPVAPDGDQDRFVLNVDNSLIVLRPDGSAFVHAVRRVGLVHVGAHSRSSRQWPARARSSECAPTRPGSSVD